MPVDKKNSPAKNTFAIGVESRSTGDSKLNDGPVLLYTRVVTGTCTVREHSMVTSAGLKLGLVDLVPYTLVIVPDVPCLSVWSLQPG